MTSRDAVNIVQRVVRPAKVGHAGTLDPLATGVLVVAVGKATRLISSVQMMPKRYVAEFQLGSVSDTEDISGEIIKRNVTDLPQRREVEAACRQFVGEIQQQPPAYSALKVNGKRAYKLARAGKDVKLEPRPITIHSINICRFEYPTLELDVECGSGTYIRSLGRDIGEALGCGAVMSALERTAIGKFKIDSACDPQTLDSEQAIGSRLKTMLDGTNLPTVELGEDEQSALRFGREIECRVAWDEFAAIGQQNQLLAIMRRTESTEHSFRPVLNFVPQ